MRFPTIVLVLSILSVPLPVLASPGEHACYVQLLGDLNLDLRVDELDYYLLERVIERTGEVRVSGSLEAMDIDRNGVLDEADLAALRVLIRRFERYGPHATHQLLVAFVCGDVNDDGRVDEADLDELFDYVTGRRARLAAALDSGDVNGDGRVDWGDVIALEDFLFSHDDWT